MLALPDHWVWDSWAVDDGETYHLFFLQAPRALGDPELRHTNASIGHATSPDLVTWTYHGTALGPSAPGGWDDVALWTGSVARGDDGTWRMFYTALGSDRGLGILDQRIGLAESDDLHTWRRVGDGPVLEPDPALYRTLGPGTGTASETWRDPFVLRDPDGDGWHLLVTARDPHAPRLDDGVLAHARSADLVHWELGPPLSVPAGFGQLEVAQVRVVDGRPLLVFTCHPDEQTPQRRAEHGDFCTWSVVGDSMLGPWDVATAVPFEAEPGLFAAPLVQDRAGGWCFVGFRHLEPHGETRLELVDPVPVALLDGRLTLRQ